MKMNIKEICLIFSRNVSIDKSLLWSALKSRNTQVAKRTIIKFVLYIAYTDFICVSIAIRVIEGNVYTCAQRLRRSWVAVSMLSAVSMVAIF